MENSDTDARLNLRELLKDEPLVEVDTWWRNLPPIYRARGRWVFDEPAELDQPRQRARRQLPPAGPNWVAPEAGCEDKHQKSSLFVKLEGESLAAWKAQCYRTTNQDFVKVCVPVTRKADEVWLRLMQKSHNSLLRPGAIDKLDHWQRRGCSQRQRDACSELLWSMQDHMTNKRGRSETKIKYGPKALPGKHGVVISDPFFSSLGRPSSAPIAHPVHRKFEAQKKAELEAQLEMARRTMEEKKRPQTAAPKGQNSNLKSTIPMRWPTAGGVPETSTQAQQRQVPISAFSQRVQKSIVATPPASMVTRMVGYPEWHGDAMYGGFRVQAAGAFTPLNRMQYTKAHARLNRVVL